MSSGITPRWFVLVSEAADAATNMATDEALLEAMPSLGIPVLRFYSWTEPAATFGYFQRIADVEAWTSLRPVVRRPTAGGIVPHDRDWTYSLSFPASHPWYAFRAIESYRAAHEWIRDAFSRLEIATELAPKPQKILPGRCFEGYEEADLLFQGKKIAGAAQRRTRSGLLIQGSVHPPQSIGREKWHQAMCAVKEQAWEKPGEFVVGTELLSRIESLARTKYALADYNRKR